MPPRPAIPSSRHPVSLSVVIPTLGRSPVLGTVLRALAAQARHSDPFEVVVVIDAVGQETSQIRAGAPDALPLVLLRAREPGASAARNAGWRATRGRLVLFLDDDMIPSTRFVREHISWHRRNPSESVGVLGSVRWSPRVTVSPFMRWLEMGIQFDHRSLSAGEVEWWYAYSCNISFKRAMLETVDGFDAARFPFGYEDLDLGRRMSQHGLRLLFNPAARTDHLKTEDFESFSPKLARIARAERRFLETYPDARPYFYDLFRSAQDQPQARGRAARLAKWVPPSAPWIGRPVWQSFDIVARQRLAEAFLSEWRNADSQPGTPPSR